MSKVKDDNFAINLWNGKGDVWCITPYCHTLKTSEETLDMLSKRSQDIHTHEQNSEAAVYKKIKQQKVEIILDLFVLFIKLFSFLLEEMVTNQSFIWSSIIFLPA